MANDLKFGNLTAAASAVIADQIEQLAPSSVALIAEGFSFALANSLSIAIRTGEIDLNEWRGFGLDQNAAIAIAEAIAKRHARIEAAKPEVAAPTLRLDMYLPPVAPLKITGIQIPQRPLGSAAPLAAPVSKHEQIHRIQALSLLHTLSEMIQRERADPTLLEMEGWSPATATELAFVINQINQGI